MNRLFVDTSGWYAFLVAREKAHQTVQSLLLDQNVELITSNTIFSELFTLLMSRGYESVALSFGDKLHSGNICAIHRISESDEEESWKILKQRRGRGLSYTDATTIALMKRLAFTQLVTLDQGFQEFGLEIFPTFI